MCSGQGSQYYHMGKDLYDAEPVFRGTMDSCSEILRPMIGLSLSELLYRPRADRFAAFDRTLYSGPAICCLQYAVAQLLRARGCAPDAVLGYSIGEVSAAVIAGGLTLADGLEAAVRLAELLEARIPEGGMLAVLARPEILRARPDVFAGTWVSAWNFPAHFVLSGTGHAIARVEQGLAVHQIGCQRLPVRFAFHSPLIEPIGEALMAHLARLDYRQPRMALISATLGGDRLEPSPEILWGVLRQPVDFARTVRVIEGWGPHTYVDLGPSGTLATFVKYNLSASSESRVASTVTPFGRAVQNMEGDLLRPVRRQAADPGRSSP